MKLHLIKPFVLWVLKKIGAWVAKINRDYRKMLSRETGLAVFIFWIVTAGLTVIAAVIGVAVSKGSPEVAAYSAGAVFTLSVVYFVYQAFSLMFAAFAKERQELFNRLKD